MIMCSKKIVEAPSTMNREKGDLFYQSKPHKPLKTRKSFQNKCLESMHSFSMGLTLHQDGHISVMLHSGHFPITRLLKYTYTYKLGAPNPKVVEVPIFLHSVVNNKNWELGLTLG